MTIVPVSFDQQEDPPNQNVSETISSTMMMMMDTTMQTTAAPPSTTAADSRTSGFLQEPPISLAEITPTASSSTSNQEDVEAGLEEETIPQPTTIVPVSDSDEEEIAKHEDGETGDLRHSLVTASSTQEDEEEESDRRADNGAHMPKIRPAVVRWKSASFIGAAGGATFDSSITTNGSNNDYIDDGDASSKSSSSDKEGEEEQLECYDAFDKFCLPNTWMQRNTTSTRSLPSFQNGEPRPILTPSPSTIPNQQQQQQDLDVDDEDFDLWGVDSRRTSNDWIRQQQHQDLSSERSGMTSSLNSSSTGGATSNSMKSTKMLKMASKKVVTATKHVVVKPAAAVGTKVVHASERTAKAADKQTGKVVKKVFGDEYSKKEGLFVTTMGFLIAFNNGMVNGATMSGLVNSAGVTQSVSGFTGTYTDSALAFAGGDWTAYGYSAFLIMSYAAGAFISGILNPHAKAYQLNPMYGPTFMIGGCFLMAAAVLAWFDSSPQSVFFLAAASNGIQNGIASIYSKNLIRVSMTGATTDLSVCVGQFLRGDRKRVHKSVVLAIICIGFWNGGLISFWMTQRFLTGTLFVNAGLYLFIGIALVWFLVSELDVSIEAAILGTWKWKGALNKLVIASGSTPSTFFGTTETSTSYQFDPELSQIERAMELFDFIDTDGDGQIEPGDLLEALISSGTKVSSKQVRILMKSADSNGDGLIDRDDWMTIVKKMGC